MARVVRSGSQLLHDAGDAAFDHSPVTLGLVGFHLVNWTSAHPEMIWASFEHKTNAPLCDGTSATSGWSFASDAAATCLSQNPSPSGTISSNCASYDFNTPPDAPSPPPTSGAPDEVCRLFENGNQPGTAINGNDNTANLLAIQQLNEALVGSNGLLTALPADNPMAIWKNYEMVGGLWTKNGAASGNPPVPYAGNPTGDPTSPQRGSLELTNMTMETYQQGPTSPIPNCFGCHNFDPTTPLDVSHIATEFPAARLHRRQARGRAMIRMLAFAVGTALVAGEAGAQDTAPRFAEPAMLQPLQAQQPAATKARRAGTNLFSAGAETAAIRAGREIHYELPIKYTDGFINNPATGVNDPVRLRSYGDRFVAPTILMKPGRRCASA